MQLSEEQVARFRRDGFLLFPGLFSKAEIAVLRAETARLASVEADSVIRERTGGVRSIFRVHEDDGATRSAAFRALSHEDQYEARHRGYGVDVAPGLRLLAARRLPAP